MTRVLSTALVAALLSCTPPATELAHGLGEPRDAFGGVGTPFAGTGFFRTERAGERWWLVTPTGGAFLSFGVTSVTPDGTYAPRLNAFPYRAAILAKYGSPEAWATATTERLRAWGFTSLGAWSREDLFRGRFPSTINASLAGADWVSGAVPDYFSDEWEVAVRQRAHERLAAYVDDAWLVGVFLDNELRWGRDWRAPKDELLRDYFRLDARSAGRAKALEFLHHEHGSIEAFNAAWGSRFASWSELEASSELPREQDPIDVQRRFLTLVAERYFAVTVAAVRAELPHHLVLGCRFVSVLTPPEALAAAARHVDVISFNSYTFVEGVSEQTRTLFGPVVETDELMTAYAAPGLPMLISEFGFRARDSGLPNSWPPIYPTFETQADRARAFEGYTRRAFRNPSLVGVHWFTWADQPATGRFDGENNNFGVVSITDEPWTPLTERMSDVFPSVLSGAYTSTRR